MGRFARYLQASLCCLAFFAFASTCAGQQPATDPSEELKTKTQSETAVLNEPPDKRILGVLPNYRTVQDTGDVKPIPPRRKLWIASKDTFDYPIWALAAGFAGIYQLENENPSFGQGAKGYFKRYGTSLTDQMMGNFLTEGAFPVLLHEDPRYFRRGTGGKWGRTAYALTRVLVTRTDSSTNRFNFSELLGNSVAVAVSNAYYPDDRDFRDNLEKVGLQFATDAISNVLKEFWPDVKRRFIHRHPDAAP